MEESISKVTEIEVLNKQDLTKSSINVKRDFAKYWDRETLNEMINQIKDPTYRMFITFMWRTGIRVTEAINLTKGDIDFENFTMTVKWLKSRKYHNRVVPLHPSVKELLQLYVAPFKHSDKVFPFSRQRAWQITKKCLKGNPHMLRHSFAVNWLRCKGDIVMLSRILGHSKIQTTMEYLKIVPVDQGKELLKITF